MKISINRQLDTDQLIDLENHVIEVAEEAYLDVEPGQKVDLEQFAVRGTIDVQSEEVGKAIIDFLSNNVKRVIIWVDDKKVVDKFGNSPLDIGADNPDGTMADSLMKPSQMVDRLLEDMNDGANLTVQELNSAYLNDYTGDLGLKKVVYVGPSGPDATSEKGAGPPTPVKKQSHEYLALIDASDMVDDGWMVSHIYVSKGSPTGGPEALHVEFAGAPMFTSVDRKQAEAFFNKEAHMKGHAKAVAAGKQATRAADDHEIWRDQQRARVASGAYRGGRGAGGARWNAGDSPHWDGNRYAL